MSASPPLAGQTVTRLYLKDGSYELVKSYQIQGDRVRYYSVERSQWEEVPLSLVDFAATRRAQAAHEAEQKQVLQQAEKTANDTYQLPPNTGLLIAPGIRMPAANGAYAYDGIRLITLIRSIVSITHEKPRTALRITAPLMRARSVVVLPGPQAGVRTISTKPVFYVHLGASLGAEVQLLRLRARKDDRILEGLDSGAGEPLGAFRSAEAVVRTQVAPGIYRLEVAHPLQPGEYALAILDQRTFSVTLWDFGVDSPDATKARRERRGIGGG